MHCPWGYRVLPWNNEGFLLLQWRSVYSGPLLLSHFSGWSGHWGDKREASASVWCKIIELCVRSLPGAALQLLKQILACPQWHQESSGPASILKCQKHFPFKVENTHNHSIWHYCSESVLNYNGIHLLKTYRWKLKWEERSVNSMHGAHCEFRWSLYSSPDSCLT